MKEEGKKFYYNAGQKALESISDSLKNEIEGYKKAFEEDSIDEYIENNPPLSPRTRQIIFDISRNTAKLHYEKIQKKAMKILNNCYVFKSENEKLSNNDSIRSINSDANEIDLKAHFIEEENEEDDRNSHSKIAQAIYNQPQSIDRQNDDQYENIDKEGDDFKNICEDFTQNLDLSILASEEIDKKSPELFEILNLFLYKTKSNLNYNQYFRTIKLEFLKIFKKFDNNKKEIMVFLDGLSSNDSYYEHKINESREKARSKFLFLFSFYDKKEKNKYIFTYSYIRTRLVPFIL